MKNSKLRRVLMLLACAVLLVCLSVGATLAYLTNSTDVVKNTFTVGNVDFDDDPKTENIDEGLDEAKVDAEGNPVDENGDKLEDYDQNEPSTWEDAPRVNENVYKLLPGHTYLKDPTVHVADDSEDAWLFVQVVNGIAPIETTNDTMTIEAQMTRLGWIKLEGYEGVENVWYYKDSVSAGDDVVVFTHFQINGTLEHADIEPYKNETITIQAYMVQKDGIYNQEDAWYFAPNADWVETTEETPAA